MKIINLFTVLLLGQLPTSILAQNLTPVIVAEVHSQPLQTQLESLATVQANESVTITSPVTEHIKNIHFKDSQEVMQGQLLFTLDDSDEQALLIEEQARLAEAQRQVKRLNQLAINNITSQSALDNQISQVTISQAKIKGIEVALAKRQIEAPFNGVLGLRKISIGALAQVGTQLITIDELSAVKLDAYIPEKYLSHIAINQTIQAKATAYPNKIFEGRVASIDSRANTSTRSIAVRIILDNTQKQLKPGMSMTVTINSNNDEQLTIPETAVLSSGAQNYVYLVDHQASPLTVKKQAITIGQRSQGLVTIESGLRAGQQVVIHGVNRIQNGTTVTITAIQKGNESLSELLNQNKDS